MSDNYNTFAEKYDELFDQTLYKQWADYVSQNTQIGSTLDLGGGSGRLAIELAKLGYKMDVLDLSPEMLMLAQKNSAKANQSIQLLQADMREWSDWKTQYELIISSVDALNYLPTQDDMVKTLQQVFEHLVVGGTFMFDVITPYQVNVLYDNYFYNNDDDPENIFMWTSYPGEIANSVDHDLKFFVYSEKIDGFKLLREVHHEQTYELDTYMQLLTTVGFKDIEVTSAFGQHPIDLETDRWFFKMKK